VSRLRRLRAMRRWSSIRLWVASVPSLDAPLVSKQPKNSACQVLRIFPSRATSEIGQVANVATMFSAMTFPAVWRSWR
jgi:hypothetical protein